MRIYIYIYTLPYAVTQSFYSKLRLALAPGFVVQCCLSVETRHKKSDKTCKASDSLMCLIG